ncbi:MAG: hypothetical protein ACKVOB_07925 [Sphingomonas sp.]
MTRTALLAFSAFGLVAAAPQPVTLISKAFVEHVVEREGTKKIELTEPGRVFPGDRMVFETAYRNSGKVPVSQFVVINAVPPQIAFSGDASDGAVVSVDGGRRYGRLSDLRITTPSGTTRAAQPVDVTHIRWTIPVITSGASGAVRYHGNVR